MTDGLYRVDWYGICAGFVICGGRLAECAPILRKRWPFWAKVAERVGD